MVWLVLGALATATLMVASVTWVLTRPHDVSAPSTPQPPRDELSVCGHDLGFPNADILASILGSAKIEETLGRSTSEVANRGRLHPSGGKWARQRGLELLVYESPAISVTATASAGAIFEVYVKLAARHPELAQALAELGSAAQLEDLSRVTCQTAVVEYRTTPSESHLTISDPAGAGRYWGNLPLMPVGRIARVGESVKANLADSAGREEARVDGVAPELRLTISDPRSPRNLAAYPFTASAGWEVQVADVIDGPAKELVLITTDYAGGSSVRLLKWSANELRTFWSGPGPVTFVPNASRSYSIRDADGVLHEYQPSRAAYN